MSEASIANRIQAFTNDLAKGRYTVYQFLRDYAFHKVCNVVSRTVYDHIVLSVLGKHYPRLNGRRAA